MRECDANNVLEARCGKHRMEASTPFRERRCGLESEDGKLDHGEPPLHDRFAQLFDGG
jgi:hypothetical protein